MELFSIRIQRTFQLVSTLIVTLISMSTPSLGSEKFENVVVAIL